MKMMSFGQRLRRERLRRYLSQEALAEALETSSKSINRWEQDQAIPQGSARLRLCRFFNLSPDELFGDFEAKNPPTQLWNVPYARNPFFTGREEILQSLHKLLNQEHAMALTQSLAVNGLGGIGKSQIVLEYAYQYRQEYRFIFWTSAATREILQTDMVTIAELLRLSERHTQDQQKVLQAVRKWFATHGDWLWILDNADDVPMLHDILPVERPGHLLLTSRAQAWGLLAQRFEVRTMGMVEATLFLLRRGKQLAHDAFLDQIAEDHLGTAETIAQEMDFLPLALDQAGAYIEEVGCSLAAYLKLYRAHRRELLQRRGHLPSDHPDPVATTWALSFQKVEHANPAAADLLHLCAFLEPDAIPEELIREGGAALGSLLQPVATDAFMLDEAIEELRKFSLIQRDPETRMLRLHRLVQVVLKDNMEPEVQRLWAERAVRATNTVFPEQIDGSTQVLCQLFLAQAQTCSVLIQGYAFTFEEATALLLRTASYLQMHALYQQAEPLYQQVLLIQEQALTPEHPSLAFTLTELAQLAFKQSKFELAEPLFKRAIHIYELASDPNVVRPLNGLANFYLEQNKSEQAEALFQRALHILEPAQTPEQSERAASLAGLGTLYLRQSKFEQAEPFLQQALEIREQYLGIEHPDVARSLHNLAHFYWQQGSYEQAEPLLQRALTIKEQQLGVDHPEVARSVHNLAALYWQQGKLQRAETLFQRAIKISEERLGIEHPDTAISLHGLALLYESQEKFAEAEPLLKRTLLIFEQKLGAEHPETGRNLHNLARIYLRQSKFEQAESFYQRALSIRQQHLGHEHPDTAESLYGLGMLYLRQGKLEQSELFHRQALSIREQHFEADHLDIAGSLHAFAELYQYQGKYELVEPLYQRALRIWQDQPLPHHPDMAQVLYDFAVFREAQDESQEALLLYQRALAIREDALGAEHPTTIMTRNAYSVLLQTTAIESTDADNPN